MHHGRKDISDLVAVEATKNQRAAKSPELWWAEPGELATCNTGTQELEQGTAAFTAWFRRLRSGVPVFAFEFPCCLLLVVGRLSGPLQKMRFDRFGAARSAGWARNVRSLAAWSASLSNRERAVVLSRRT
jgi:hypothetical protein